MAKGRAALSRREGKNALGVPQGKNGVCAKIHAKVQAKTPDRFAGLNFPQMENALNGSRPQKSAEILS